MSEKTNLLKRNATRDGSVSPPPMRRKIVSTTTNSAVASFFKPASEKPPEKISWHERAENDDKPATLLVGKYVPSDTVDPQSIVPFTLPRRKIAAFDFDSTLISTSSGKKHASGAGDWKWWHPSVPGMLRKLYDEEDYLVVIISNQAGIALKANVKASSALKARCVAFKTKATSVLAQLNLPVSIYAATEKDIYRKPRTGMWTELLDDNDLSAPGSVDLENSFFVGDAGGRPAATGVSKDFSCSDRDFADNVGIKFFTPEEYFLKHKQREFKRAFDPRAFVETAESEENVVFEKKNSQDMVLFVGSPGSGKSTFYSKHLKPLGYVRVNQDTLKTRDKCFKVAEENLSEGKSVVIDNTNADTEIRGKWLALAKKHNIPVRCVHFQTDPEIAKHNDMVRALNASMNPENRKMLPGIAFGGYTSRYKKPEISEGFQDIIEVPFKFRGTEEEKAIWGRYYTGPRIVNMIPGSKELIDCLGCLYDESKNLPLNPCDQYTCIGDMPTDGAFEDAFREWATGLKFDSGK